MRLRPWFSPSARDDERSTGRHYARLRYTLKLDYILAYATVIYHSFRVAGVPFQTLAVRRLGRLAHCCDRSAPSRALTPKRMKP